MKKQCHKCGTRKDVKSMKHVATESGWIELGAWMDLCPPCADDVRKVTQTLVDNARAKAHP